MPTLQTQIAELFELLPVTEQQELARRLYEKAVQDDAGFELTTEQRAALDLALRQVERGEVLSAAELRAAISKRFGFSTT